MNSRIQISYQEEKKKKNMRNACAILGQTENKEEKL